MIIQLEVKMTVTELGTKAGYALHIFYHYTIQNNIKVKLQKQRTRSQSVIFNLSTFSKRSKTSSNTSINTSENK